MFLITFSHLLKKICYERAKIKICHKCFLTFLIPSAYFLLPSWISTVTFHLHITSGVFPSMYSLQTCARHVSWVCMAGPNCLCDNTHAMSYYIHDTHYIHDTFAVSDYVHKTKFCMPLRLTVQCNLNQKTLMYQLLIIVDLIVIICSQ